MKTTTVLTVTVHGDANLEYTVREVADLVAHRTGFPVDAVVERAKHVGPFYVAVPTATAVA